MAKKRNDVVVDDAADEDESSSSSPSSSSSSSDDSDSDDDHHGAAAVGATPSATTASSSSSSSDDDDDDDDFDVPGYESYASKHPPSSTFQGYAADGADPYAFDKGAPLAESDFTYLKEIKALCAADDFESPEDRRMMIGNAFTEVSQRVYRYAVNKQGSLALEALLPHASSRQIRRLFASMCTGENMMFALWECRNASHVLQLIMRRAATLLRDEHAGVGDGADADDDDDDDNDAAPTPSMTTLIELMCEQLKPRWVDVMYSAQGSYLIRDLLQLLSGYEEADIGSDRVKKGQMHGGVFVKGSANGYGQRAKQKQHESTQHGQDVVRSIAHVKSLSGVIEGVFATLMTADVVAMSMDTSAGPGVQALLKCLASSTELRFKEMTRDLVARLLKWKVVDDDAAAAGADTGDAVDAAATAAPKKKVRVRKRHLKTKVGRHGGVELPLASLKGRGTTPESQRHVAHLLDDRVGSHLMEVIIRTAHDEVFNHVFNAYFKSRLSSLTEQPYANFAVQALFSRLRNGQQVGVCYEELQSHLGTLFRRRRAGVVHQLALACERTESKQKALIAAVAAGVGVVKTDHSGFDQSLVERLLYLDDTVQRITEASQEAAAAASNIGDDDANSNISRSSSSVSRGAASQPTSANRRVSVPGSLIVQCFLRFHPKLNKTVVDSILHVRKDMLLHWICHPIAGRVLEAIIVSGVDTKIKQTLIDRVSGSYVACAVDRYGSYWLEKAYDVADIARKKRITEELVVAESRLSGSQGGRLLIRKCQLRKFKSQNAQWAQQHTSDARRKAMFRGLLDEYEKQTTPSSSSSSPSLSSLATSSDNTAADLSATTTTPATPVSAATVKASSKHPGETKEERRARKAAPAVEKEQAKAARKIEKKQIKREKRAREEADAAAAADAGVVAVDAFHESGDEPPKKKKAKKKTAKEKEIDSFLGFSDKKMKKKRKKQKMAELQAETAQ